MNIVWYPTLRCNLKCAYCNARSLPVIEHGKEQTANAWQELFWSCRRQIGDLIICGGEPSLYQGLDRALETLPLPARVHVATNLAIDPESWLTESVRPRIGSLLLSLHFDPSDKRAASFWLRAQWVRGVLPETYIRAHVTRTQQLMEEPIATAVRMAAERGLDLEITDFDDHWNWRNKLPERDGEAVCGGGADLVVLMPDGTAYRCLGHAYSNRNELEIGRAHV